MGNRDQEKREDSGAVDPRDEAVATEVAYRMQSRWTGADMQSAARTAAALARAEGRAEVLSWFEERERRGLATEGLVWEARFHFWGPSC